MGVVAKSRRISGDGSVYQDKQGRWIASLDVVASKKTRTRTFCAKRVVNL